MQPFESWDLAAIPIRPRSRFYALEPIGVGTPQVESLTGYLVRLAAAHAVRVGDLVIRELRSQIAWVPGTTQIGYSMDGVGKTAERWVSVLERLTSVEALRFLTLLPFAQLFPTPRLLRSERAWCPQCYACMRDDGQTVYEPLLWSMKSVEVCVRHRRPLETTCPDCKRSLRPLASMSRPGYCSSCHRWLGQTQSLNSTRGLEPTNDKYWIAEECGTLLSLAPRVQHGVVANNLGRVLTSYVGAFAKGNILAVAEAGRCSITTFHSWCTGLHPTARIDVLLQVCHQLKIPLSYLVSGTAAEFNSAEIDIDAARITQNRTERIRLCRNSPEHLRLALQQALHETPAPTLNEVAWRMGYATASQLRLVDPECCKQISLNYHNSDRSYWWRKPGAKPKYARAYIRNILEKALALDLPTPVHHLAAALDYSTASSLMEGFPDLCRAIKAKRKVRTIERKMSIKPLLKAALRERPIPSLKEIAIRHSISVATLRNTAPDLCEAIKGRRGASEKTRYKKLGEQLHAVLREKPPPSMREVYNRFGTERWIARKHFPELNRALAIRSVQYRQRRSALGLPIRVSVKP